MYLIVLVLNKTEYLREVLKAFTELGIKGATILDSIGAGRMRNLDGHYIPLVGGLMRVLENGYPHNRTIFSVVESKEIALKAADRIEEIVGDLTVPGTGIFFCVPVEFFRGGALGHYLNQKNEPTEDGSAS